MSSFKLQVFVLIVSILMGSACGNVVAVDSPWNSSNRIAISADGNPDADADDVGATALTLAILAKAKLQNNLVHCDFNNFLNYKKIDASKNRMWMSAMGGQKRWGFESSSFFDASSDPEGAIEHLASEINKSTLNDPLYLIAAGPMELLYRALKISRKAARRHVIIVSHHNYNEFFKARLWHRNWNDVKSLVPDIGYIRIKDQNGWDGSGLKGKSSNDFDWLRKHSDPNLNWVFERVLAGKPDVSDTGMVTWLIGLNGDDEMLTIAELNQWLGADSIDVNGGTEETPEPPVGKLPVVRPPSTKNVFLEVGGKIVIEAESIPLKDDWILDDEEPGFSGKGYIRWMPPYKHKISHQHEGVLVYKLRISNPGVYRMALRSSHKGAPERDKWNDCWTLMGLNPVSPYGITRKTYHSITQEQFDSGLGFTWHTTHDNYGTVAKTDGHFSKPEYQMNKGDHYFWICGRSAGYRIDKIHFFRKEVAGFKNDTEPLTPVIQAEN